MVIIAHLLTEQQSLLCERNITVLQMDKFHKDFNGDWVINCCLELASIMAKSYENAE